MTDDHTRVRELLHATATLMPTDLELARPALAMARRRKHTHRIAYSAAVLATAFAAAAGTGAATIWKAHSPAPHRTQAGTTPAAAIEHSTIPPVAKRATMVVTRSDGLHAVDGAGHDHLFTVPGVQPGFAKIGLSWSGTQLAVSDALHGTSLIVVDLPTGRVTSYRQPGVVFWMRWSPDDRKVLFEVLKPNPHTGHEPVSVTGTITVMTLATGQEHELSGDLNGMYDAYWAPDSARVLARDRTGWAYLDLTGKVVQRLPQLAAYASGYGVSPDGRSFIALRSPASGVGDLHVVDLKTGAVLASPTVDQLGGGGYGTIPAILGWSGPDEIAIRGETPARLLGYDWTTRTLRTVRTFDSIYQLALPGT